MTEHLYAGPFLGELGVELGWAAGVRYASQYAERTTVCTFTGREALYADFADEIVTHPFTPVSIGCQWEGPPSQEEVNRLIPPDAKHYPAVETVCGGNAYVEPVGDKQTFIRYGKKLPEWKGAIIIHARCRFEVGGHRNWPLALWNQLVPLLSARRVISVGRPDRSYRVAGTEDMRGVPLARLMDMFASCWMVIGPSSGPMHLASLCGAPHLTWFGGDRIDDAREMATLWNRYKTDWNPFRVPVAVVKKLDWQPSVREVLALFCQFVCEARLPMEDIQ